MTPAQILIQQATIRGEILKIVESVVQSPLPEDGDRVVVPKQAIDEIRQLFVKLSE